MSRPYESSPLLGSAAYPGARYPAPARHVPSSFPVPSDVASDAELAARLQREEHQRHARAPEEEQEEEEERAERGQGGYQQGAARGGAGVGRGVGAGAGGGRAREQVREAMLGELVTQARFTAFSFYLLLLVNGPQIALIAYFSVAHADKFMSCDRPLSLWLILFGMRLVLSTVVAGLPVCSPRRWSPLGERYRRWNDSVNLLGFAVFIMGSFWIFDSRDCREENPEIFKLAFWLLMIQYAIMLLPCVLLCCLAPCVFFCLPLLIRVSGYLPAGVGLRLAGQQGASASLISRLPPPKKFEPGMFGGGAPTGRRQERKETDSPTATNHEEPECAICLSNYEVGQMVRQLPCAGAHHFHQKCIDDWLKVNATCPCDREQLLPLMVDPSRARAAQPAAPQPSPPASAAAVSANERRDHPPDSVSIHVRD